MSNLTQVSLLNCIDSILEVSFGKGIVPDEHILASEDLKFVSDFFKVNYIESILMSLLIESGIRNEEVSINNLLEHFGDKISYLPAIHEGLNNLIKKGLIVANSSRPLEKTLIKQMFKVEEKVFEAVLSNNTKKLNANPIKSFTDFLQRIDEIIQKRLDGDFNADTVKNVFRNLLKTSSNFKEVKWLNKHKGLTTFDKLLFFIIVTHYYKTEKTIDIEYLIKQMEDDFGKQALYLNQISEKSTALFTNDLICLEDEQFIFDEYVGPSDYTVSNILMTTRQKSSKSKITTGTLLYPKDLIDEQLYYNESETSQIAVIKKVLNENKYKDVIKKLEINGLGKGISILFNGFSGTGKTATAKAIAKETNRILFCVDIEKIIDKWVGDSEKNVKKIFQEYYSLCKENTNKPILFFNEDSIFSNRVNVRTSTDRSHNSIQNILLEQLENFDGIAIITSNHAENLDAAFERRFLYKLTFSKPDKSVQEKIILKGFPELKRETVDFVLTRYDFTGGQIYNIRKKLIMEGLVVEEMDLDFTFSELCGNEVNNNSIKKIGYKS